MLNSGKKNSCFARQKKNILTLVLSGKKFLNEKKTITPPCKLNGRFLMSTSININGIISYGGIFETCVSVTVWKQTTPEIACVRRTVTVYLHKRSLIWVIRMVHEFITCLIPLVAHI